MFLYPLGVYIDIYAKTDSAYFSVYQQAFLE